MRNRPLLGGLLVALLLLLADQVSKQWLIALMAQHRGHLELLPWFNLVMVWNKGVSFGMLAGADARYALAALSGVVILFLLAWLSRAQGRLLPLALGLIIGGAGGNLIDRLYYGAVADFFDAHAFGYHWPAFNIADAGIVCGVVLLLWQSWKEK